MNEVNYRFNARVRITTIDIRRPHKDQISSGDIYIHDIYPVPEKFQVRADGSLYRLMNLAQTMNSTLYSMLPGSSAGFDLSIENGEIVAQMYIFKAPFFKGNEYNKEEFRAQLARNIYEQFHYFATCFV